MVRIYGYEGRRGNNVNFKHQSHSRIEDCSGYRFRRKFKHSLFFYRCRDREFVADYSSWVYQRNCPLFRLNSVFYGLTLTLTISRKFRLKAWRCVNNSLLVPRQVSRNSSSVIRKFLVNHCTRPMSGETVYTLLFSWQEYAEIKAEEEIILILNTRVTAVSRTVQDIDSGENSSTVCFFFFVSL